MSGGRPSLTPCPTVRAKAAGGPRTPSRSVSGSWGPRRPLRREGRRERLADTHPVSRPTVPVMSRDPTRRTQESRRSTTPTPPRSSPEGRGRGVVPVREWRLGPTGGTSSGGRPEGRGFNFPTCDSPVVKGTRAFSLRGPRSNSSSGPDSGQGEICPDFLNPWEEGSKGPSQLPP